MNQTLKAFSPNFSVSLSINNRYCMFRIINIPPSRMIGLPTGIIGFLLAKREVDKNRLKQLKVRQRMRKSNEGEYEGSRYRHQAEDVKLDQWPTCMAAYPECPHKRDYTALQTKDWLQTRTLWACSINKGNRSICIDLWIHEQEWSQVQLHMNHTSKLTSTNVYLLWKGKHTRHWYVYLQTHTPRWPSVLHIQNVCLSCFESRVVCNRMNMCRGPAGWGWSFRNFWTMPHWVELTDF